MWSGSTRTRDGRRAAIGACAALAAVASAALAAPPVVAPGAVRTLYLGVDVADPYRALEKVDDPAVQAWRAAQADYARAELAKLPARRAFVERLEALDRALPEQASWVARAAGGRIAWLRERPGAAAALVVRDGPESPARVLLDPARTGAAVRAAALSPDGRQLAVVTASPGAEAGTLAVLDAATGAPVGAAIPRVLATPAPVWLPGAPRVAYAVRDPGGAPGTRVRLAWRAIGGDDGAEHALFGYRVAGAPPVAEADRLALAASGGSDWLVATAESADGTARAWTARLKDLENPKKLKWKPVADGRFAFGANGALPAGDWLYARVPAQARGALVRFDLSDRRPAPVPVVPEPAAGVLDAFTVAQDAVYYVLRDATTGQLLRIAYGEKPETAQPVPLPFAARVEFVSASADLPGLFVRLQGWTESPRVYALAAPAKAAPPPSPVDTGLSAPAAFDTARYAATEATCPARDGTAVPVTVLARKDRARDRTAATLVRPYAIDGRGGVATFVPGWFAWLERGGVLAIVNARGGGALGEDWHRAGTGATRANAWHDVVDCAQWLVDERWTSPGGLVLWATGRLAVPAARAALERPALFGAAVLQDGAYDLVRTLELLPDGRTDPEFGALAPRAAVESTVDASPYHQVRDGIRYPGVLLVEGPNADGAPPWSATKFLARLQAASTRGRPLLLDARTAQDGPDDRRARLATAFAFALREARTGGTVD